MKTYPCYIHVHNFPCCLKLKKKSNIFNIFAQNNDCGYTLEQPIASIELLQSKLNKKSKCMFMYIPVDPSFTVKSGM